MGTLVKEEGKKLRKERKTEGKKERNEWRNKGWRN
jgi:hypothetical protein